MVLLLIIFAIPVGVIGPAIDTAGSPAKFGVDAFVVIEKWESPEALKAHAAAPHMAAYGAKTRDLIRDDGQLSRWPRPGSTARYFST